MGLLALFLFEKVNDEPYANYDLVEFQIEATDKMLIYLTVSKQLSIYSKTLLHYLPDEQLTNPYDYDLEIGSASMMNEFLNALYDEVYDMPEQVFPQDEFDSAFHDYWFEDESPSQYNANDSMNIFDYFFSPYGTLYDRIIFGSLSVIFIIVSGGAGILKGKGGFSAGGGLFRHR